MLDIKKTLNGIQPLDRSIQLCQNGENGWVVATLFFAAAYLAGTKRCFEGISVMHSQNFYFGATAASMGLVASHYARPLITPQKQTLTELVLKCVLVFTAVKCTTSWIAEKLGKEAIYVPSDSQTFGKIAVGIVIGGRVVRTVVTPRNREVNLESLKGDYRSIERVPLDCWSFTPEVSQFNPDTLLDMVGDDDVLQDASYQQLFQINGSEFLDRRDTTRLDGVVRKYTSPYALNPQEQAIKWYLNKILGYLLLKKRALQADTDQKQEQRIALQDLIETTIKAINDAHQNCPDQVLSQLQLLVVDIADDFGMTELQKLVSVLLAKYRVALIKEVVQETGEYHAADLEVALSREIHNKLGLPLPRSLQSGAMYSSIFNLKNYMVARYRFFQRYKPLEFLVTNCNYHTERKLFAGVGQWFGQKVFAGDLDEAVEQERVAIFGSDFLNSETMDQRKDGAIVYALFKSGCIC